MVPGCPVVWIDAVGLTPRLLAHAPALAALAARGSSGPLGGVVPAVTLTAQATALTGLAPDRHGVVGNGWYRRETGEVRFWVQAQAQVEGETVEQAARAAARARGVPFTAARVFGWFAQGAPVEWMVTPKPWYGSDGSKVFGVHGRPDALAGALERALGPFPFASFWGPRAGLPSTQWIARAAATVLREHRPHFTFVYLPHLDYDLQRLGPVGAHVAPRVRELDAAAADVLDAARAVGAEVTVFSEYGLVPVARVVEPNRALRRAGLLAVRDGPFGEALEPFESAAFAVCDHQIAHVVAPDAAARARAKDLLAALPGVARVLEGAARGEVGLDHPRAGDLVLLAERDAWFAYPWWLDDARAPDYARTVDIHRKPGYDPCELFVDPALRAPGLRVARRLLAKRLGFRYRMDVVPLDASLVRGSHGLPPADPQDGPLLVSEDPAATRTVRALSDLKAHALSRLGLA
ncbi:MAG: alkaline phosphatase family protein [Planctomycetes bacterium]|nr:alkaline phosphatase family protein [Planctomycetota bacterium]